VVTGDSAVNLVVEKESGSGNVSASRADPAVLESGGIGQGRRHCKRRALGRMIDPPRQLELLLGPARLPIPER
jgi:hypothetical protein